MRFGFFSFAALVLVASLQGTTPSTAQTPVAPCTDRLASQPGIAPESLRLPNLSYECVQLQSGRHLLAGVAGAADRPAVLLIHGLGDNAHRDWRQLIPDLAQDYQVIAIDLPGFGGSDSLPNGYSFPDLAQTIDELLDRKKLQRVHLIGHSLGGAVALYFAHAHPDRLNRLVLIDAAGILLKSVYVHHVSQITTPELGIGAIDALVSKLDRGLNGLNRHILQRLENGFDFSGWLAENPGIRGALLGGFTQTDAALGLIEHDFTRAIRETKTPTTIIWGRNDDVSPLRVGKLLDGRMPNAELHVLERTGHMPMTESTDETLRLVLQGLVAEDEVEPEKPPTTTTSPEAVECVDRSNQVYSGTFTTVSLRNCRDARLEHARIEKLIVADSSVALESVSIMSPEDVAMDVTNSYVTATVLQVAGDTAIRAANSQLDIAGGTIRANERAIQSDATTRIYFSVSDVHAPEFSGDVHRIWTEPSAATN